MGISNMKKFLLILAMLLSSSYASAREDVPIITRFEPSTGSYQSLVIWSKEMNELQSDYNFILQVVPGAQGENADNRAIALSRAGQKVIWFGSSASFTTNKILFQNDSWNREADIVPVLGFSVTSQVMFTNASRYKTFKELQDKILKSETTFYGAFQSGGGAETVRKIFVNHFNIESKIKIIRYKNIGEITLALANGEIDFTIQSQGYGSVPGLAPLIVSARERIDHDLYRDVPTGLELGMKDYVFMGTAFFGVPKEQHEFSQSILKLMIKLCDNQQIKELKSKTGQIPNCDSSDVIKKMIDAEYKTLTNIIGR